MPHSTSSSSNLRLFDLIHPTERQKEFFQAMDTHRYTLYGGAKGGGKSYVLRWAMVRQLMRWAAEGFRGVRAGLFCEDYPTLKDRQISRINQEFPLWLGTLSNSAIEGMSFVLDDKWGGGVLALRNLDDVSKYASSEFAMVGIDELTKNQREIFDQLRSIIRWPGIEDTKFIGATNPGGIGHDWVKKIWIDRKFGSEDPESEDVAFVKSLPTDNPHNADSYIESLTKLPEKLRKAYLEGNWDIFEGQYFTEWDRQQHVVEPFTIPATWKRFRSIDPSGQEGITSCHWYALDSDGSVWVYKEYYKTGLDYDQHADNIAAMSKDRDGINEEYVYTVIDTAAFAKGGFSDTATDIFERHGVQGLVPAHKERLIGWNAVHQFLRWDMNTKPLLKIFSTCDNMIRTLPLLIHDDLHPEDVDSDGEDHAADELRYFLRTVQERKAPQPMNEVQKRIAAVRDREHANSFNYQYNR